MAMKIVDRYDAGLKASRLRKEHDSSAYIAKARKLHALRG